MNRFGFPDLGIGIGLRASHFGEILSRWPKLDWFEVLNHGFEAERYIDAIPADRIVQYHLAGHTNKGTHIIDTHGGPALDAVWALYARACARTGPVSTLFEWDEAIPSFDEVRTEAAKAAPLRGVEALATGTHGA